MPVAGQAEAWAFPVPQRGGLPTGLKLQRCHRPGQQVIAVEICLDAPLDAEPDGLDGVATIMVRALSQGAARTLPRSSRPNWSAAVRRSARTSTTSARASRWRCPPPACAGRSGLLAEALRAPTFAVSEIERLVRNRLDAIPHELASPGQARSQAAGRGTVPGVVPDVPAAPGHRGDGLPDRRRRRARVLRGAHAAGHGDRGMVGDLTRTDLDALLPDTLGAWAARRGRAAAPFRP